MAQTDEKRPPRGRATNAQMEIRSIEVMHLRITEGASTPKIAQALGVTKRTVQRDLAALRDARPSPQVERAVGQYSHYYDQYGLITIRSTKLATEALKNHGFTSPERTACDQLRTRAVHSIGDLRDAVAGDDAPLASSDDLRPNQHLDIVKRFDRTREFYDAPKDLVRDVREALIQFGPRNLMPRKMSRGERELRMALACFATDFMREEIAEAFDCSAKTVTRTKERALAREPRLRQWGEEMRHALQELELTYNLLKIKLRIEEASIDELKALADLLDRITEAYLLLGLFVNGPLDRFELRREDLLNAVRETGEKHGIPPDGCDHMITLAMAWADNKPLPGGRPPLPKRKRNLDNLTPQGVRHK